MTLQEIKDRLDAEFPDRHVAFGLDITSFKGNPNCTGPDDPQAIEMTLYDSELKHFPCATLEEGIRALKSKLGTLTPEMEIAA
jgi:hypothetical protein